MYCPVEYGIFSLHLCENATPLFFVRVLSQGEAFAHFFKPHSEFFCERQLTHHWAIAAVPKKTMTKYLGGGGGMGSMDWLSHYNYSNSLIYTVIIIEIIFIYFRVKV